jgi:hypothetical protein
MRRTSAGEINPPHFGHTLSSEELVAFLWAKVTIHAREAFGSSLLVQNAASCVPIYLSMSTNIISLTEASLLLDKLVTEPIAVVAFFVSVDGSKTVLRGFVDSITLEDGILISATRGKPNESSTLAVGLPGDPLGADCTFVYGDKRELDESRREELSAKYGDAALSILFPSGSRLNLLFTP